jgi:predicted transposase/invertase (TIGR01784 family)
MTTRYLDPTTDIAFKKLFGDKAHENVTRDFLNNVLGLKDGERIVTLNFSDTFNRKENDEDRLSIVDVRCTDEAGNVYIVEMQARFEPDFKERCQYYVASELASQLNESDPFAKLTPVKLVCVLGLSFGLFKHKRYLSHHLLIDTEDYKNYLEHIAFHFVELKKFTKTEEELSDDVERWIFFLKHAAEYQDKPTKISKGNKAIADAFEIITRVNWNKAELRAYAKSVDTKRRNKSVLEYERTEERMLERTLIAKKLLTKKIDIEDIAEVTGLSVDVIKKMGVAVKSKSLK